MERRPDAIVIGADEVGRGCVFGPLTVAATANVVQWSSEWVRDSKTVKSEKRRHRIAAQIMKNMMWNCASISAEFINSQGMSQALNMGYITALDATLKRVHSMFPDRLIDIVIDGNDMDIISGRYGSKTTQVIAIPRADATVFEVSAASLVAKSTRDNWIHEAVKQHPTLAVYDLDENKGYGTTKHTQALIQHGRTLWHRNQFCDSLVKHFIEKAHAQNSPATH